MLESLKLMQSGDSLGVKLKKCYDGYMKVYTYEGRNFNHHANREIQLAAKAELDLYSKLAVGYTRGEYTTGKDADGVPKKDTSENNFLNFQAPLAGIEAGGDHVRGFTELGFSE